MPYVKE